MYSATEKEASANRPPINSERGLNGSVSIVARKHGRLAKAIETAVSMGSREALPQTAGNIALSLIMLHMPANEPICVPRQGFNDLTFKIGITERAVFADPEQFVHDNI